MFAKKKKKVIDQVLSPNKSIAGDSLVKRHKNLLLLSVYSPKERLELTLLRNRFKFQFLIIFFFDFYFFRKKVYYMCLSMKQLFVVHCMAAKKLVRLRLDEMNFMNDSNG